MEGEAAPFGREALVSGALTLCAGLQDNAHRPLVLGQPVTQMPLCTASSLSCL